MPERGGAQAAGQARQVFLFPAPGRFDPAAAIAPARRPTGPFRAGEAARRRSAASMAAMSVPGAASSWMKNWPARCAAACAVSIQVATLSVSTNDCQRRDRRPPQRRSASTSRIGTSRWARGTVRQPRRHRAADSDSARTKPRRPDWSGSTIAGRGRGESPAGHIREMAGDPVQGRVGVEIADDDQDGPVRPVVCLVERSQVVGADPRDVLGPAQDRVAIRMTKVGDRQMGLVEPSLGRIELAGPFLDDDAPLDLDLAGSNRAPCIRSASIASASSQRSFGNANQ